MYRNFRKGNLKSNENTSFFKNLIKNFMNSNLKNNRLLKISKKDLNQISTDKIEQIKINEINKPTIYIAKSNNIVFNLSTEEFFYECQNIKKPILFLYQNDTNVVIGKHQNPWKECKITNMKENNVKLASNKNLSLIIRF